MMALKGALVGKNNQDFLSLFQFERHACDEEGWRGWLEEVGKRAQEGLAGPWFVNTLSHAET